jgi:predicted DCC family thiol-disulfide oxidoreductase YuxK
MDDATLVYDDDCGFCTWSADWIVERSDLELVGFSELSPELLERLPDDYEECAHLVTDDAVYSCGESVEQALLRSEYADEIRPLYEFARQFEEYADLRERAYRWGADNRDKLGKIVSKTPPARKTDD